MQLRLPAEKGANAKGWRPIEFSGRNLNENNDFLSVCWWNVCILSKRVHLKILILERTVSNQTRRIVLFWNLAFRAKDLPVGVEGLRLRPLRGIAMNEEEVEQDVSASWQNHALGNRLVRS